jgi:hypothetical protein
MELSGGTFRGEIHDVVANDTHGVALVTFHGERDGQTVALRSADIWHLASGIWQTADGRRQTADGRRQTADGKVTEH